MRIGVPLSTLRKEVQMEAGLSTKASHAVQSTERLNHLINRVERVTYAMDDWPSLEIEEEVSVVADAQFVSLPTGMTFAMINDVWVAYGDDWIRLSHGIGIAERSIYPDTARASPIMRWEIRAPGNVDFEVWPRSAQIETLRFTGMQILGGMLKDGDTCVIDADILVLRCAAELLAKDDKADAGIKLETARSLTASLLKRLGPNKKDSINLGHRKGRTLRPGIDFIPPGS